MRHTGLAENLNTTKTEVASDRVSQLASSLGGSLVGVCLWFFDSRITTQARPPLPVGGKLGTLRANAN